MGRSASPLQVFALLDRGIDRQPQRLVDPSFWDASGLAKGGGDVFLALPSDREELGLRGELPPLPPNNRPSPA